MLCPLCQNHLDNQASSDQCEIVKDILEMSGNTEDAYEDEVKESTAHYISKILNIREDNI